MIFHVSVRDRIATYEPQENEKAAVCENSGDTVEFSFDSEWQSHNKKTARFIFRGKYIDVEFVGNTCPVPIIEEANSFNVGVYVGEMIEDGYQLSSTRVTIPSKYSIRDYSKSAHDESGKNYTNEARGYATMARESANVALSILNSIPAGYTDIANQVSKNSKRITNLEKGLTPDPFYTDNTVAYSKIVPANALPYAEVSKVGGMTYRDESTNTLRDAKVTAIDTIGQNVSDISSLSTGYFFDNGGQPTPTDIAGYLRFYAPKVRPNTTYTLTTNLPIYTIWEDDGANPTTIHEYYHTTQQTVTFTTDSTCKRLRVSFRDGDQVGVSALQWCMLNVGSVALPYVPYDPNANKTLAIPSSVQDLDGYGLGLSATYHNYIDWETKSFVQEVKKYDLSTLRFKVGSSGNYYYSDTLKNIIKTDLVVSSNYKKSASATVAGMGDGELLVSAGALYLKDSSIASSADIVGEAVFVLTTPITTDISDLLPDDNFIEVVGNGSVYAVNEKADAVPTEITYMLKEETV